MLKLETVHSHYGQIHALKGISLSVQAGNICCLIGANGAGKSTTLMCISGIKNISSGSIEFEGRTIHTLSPEKIVGLGIVQVPEGRRIFPYLTVQENLMMGAYRCADKAKVYETLEKYFDIFPILKDRNKQMGGTLSGGEQQMLAIARALMGSPRLLLLDEPSLGLAPLVVENIMNIIRQIKSEGLTILLVEQNAQAALELADYGYVIETGEVVLEDAAADLLQNARVKEAYLGEG
ncbi:MAG: ABC transporter ATP-binding protein [Deltaproteobacteria bacterium]|nr:ABC transporter ATP-binding protein [Deltaproteobacteria bacterium]MBW2040736.1 ABC transporter ATP-binding protein [Deltaproteobacteria bacterium]MBW2131140.1 ABC transporter ATP-binding protein [Deltaproteobacteria bacterium]